jgi:hypothetical protein
MIVCFFLRLFYKMIVTILVTVNIIIKISGLTMGNLCVSSTQITGAALGSTLIDKYGS